MGAKIFISHGHGDLAKHKLKDFVRDRLHKEAVVLADQPDLGLTIVEKLEHYVRECQFALILLTGDDETASGGLRARQNVIHELGYFHGVLGRKRVLLLKEAGVELFSNISGLIYKEFPTGSIELAFEDIRLAIESDDASQHASSVPIQSSSAYTDGDWITAAIVGPEHAETKLKELVGEFRSLQIHEFNLRSRSCWRSTQKVVIRMKHVSMPALQRLWQIFCNESLPIFNGMLKKGWKTIQPQYSETR